MPAAQIRRLRKGMVISMKKKQSIMRFLLQAVCLLLFMIFSGGCGRTDEAGAVVENDAAAAEDDEENQTDENQTNGKQPDPDVTCTEPPAIELRSMADETNYIIVKSCGYNWTYLEPGDQATSVLADSAAPLSEGASWVTLNVSDNTPEGEDYRLLIPNDPDELFISVWNTSDIGKDSVTCKPVESRLYGKEEITAENFAIPVRADGIYELCITWEEENAEKTGFYGIAYYTLKTAGAVTEAALVTAGP